MQGQEGAMPPQTNVWPTQIKILEIERAHFNRLQAKKIYYKSTKLTAVAEKSTKKGRRYKLHICPSVQCVSSQTAVGRDPALLSKHPITISK